MAAYFNVTLFKRNLTRFWLLAAVSFFASLFFFIVPEVANNQSYSFFYMPEQKDIMPTLAAYCGVVVFVLSVFTAIAMFGYLHNQKAAGFVSSLPITRKGLYITNWLSGLTLMLVPALFVGVFYGFLLVGQPVPQGDLFRWFGALIASHLIFFSIAVFCTFLTGNPVMQAFIYGLFNFICFAFYYIVVALSTLLVFGYTPPAYVSGFSLVNVLTPPVAIIDMIQRMSPVPSALIQSPLYHVSYQELVLLPSFLYWVFYLLFAALLAVLGYLLYKRRRIEVTGEVIVHKPVRSVFKYLMGLLTGVLFAIIITFLFAGGQWRNTLTNLTLWFTISLMIFGGLGCLFAEMLIQKRLNVWKTAKKGLIVFVAAIAAIMLFVRLDGTGFERRVPDKNEVVSVSLSNQPIYYSNTRMLHMSHDGVVQTSGYNWSLSWAYRAYQQENNLPMINDEILNEIKLRTPEFFESPEAINAAITLHQAIVDNRWKLDEIMDGYDEGWFPYYLTYTLKDGSILTREYAFPIKYDTKNGLIAQLGDLMLDLYNQPEAVNKRNRFVGLSDESILGATVLPNISLDYGTWWYSPDHHLMRGHNGTTIFSRDALDTLIEALRKDVDASTLGRISNADLLFGRHYSFGVDHILGIVDLLLDARAAGVPSSFDWDDLLMEPVAVDEDEHEKELFIGLFNYFIIIAEHVNTVQALKELGLLED